MKWVSAVIPSLVFLFVAVSGTANAEHAVYVQKSRAVYPDGEVVRTKTRTVVTPYGVTTTYKVRNSYWPAYGYSPYSFFSTPWTSTWGYPTTYANYTYNNFYNPSSYYTNPYSNYYNPNYYQPSTSYQTYPSYPTTTVYGSGGSYNGVSYSRTVTFSSMPR